MAGEELENIGIGESGPSASKEGIQSDVLKSQKGDVFERQMEILNKSRDNANQLKEEVDARKKALELKRTLDKHEKIVEKAKFHNEFENVDDFEDRLLEASTSYDPLEMAMGMTEHPPQTDAYRLTTRGLAALSADIEHYGIKDKNPALYESMISALHDAAKALDSNDLNKDARKILDNLSIITLENPAMLSNLAQLTLFDEAMLGFDPKLFAAAYSHAVDIRKTISDMNIRDKAVDDPTIMDTVTEGADHYLAKAGNFYRETWESGNPLKIALVFGGSYLLGRKVVYPMLSRTWKEPGKAVALLAVAAGGLGAAEYFGVTDLKFTGSSQNTVNNILDKNGIEIENFDQSTIFDLYGKSLSELKDLYDNANAVESGFIPPNSVEYGFSFSTFNENEYLSKAEQNEMRADSGLWATNTLNTTNRDYVDKGREYYAAISALAAAFNHSELAKTPKYRNKDFWQVVDENPDMTVRHLVMALSAEETMIKQREENEFMMQKDEIEARLASTGYPVEVKEKSEKFPNLFVGTFQTYPVYFQFNPVDNNYYVFAPYDLPEGDTSFITNFDDAIFKVPPSSLDKDEVDDKMWFKVWENSVFPVVGIEENFPTYGNIENMTFGFIKDNFVLQYKVPEDTFYTSAVITFDNSGNPIFDDDVSKLIALGVDPKEVHSQLEKQTRIQKIKATDAAKASGKLDDEQKAKMAPGSLHSEEELKQKRDDFEKFSREQMQKIIDGYEGIHSELALSYSPFLIRRFDSHNAITTLLKSNAYNQQEDLMKFMISGLAGLSTPKDPESLDLQDEETKKLLAVLYFRFFDEKYRIVEDSLEKELDEYLVDTRFIDDLIDEMVSNNDFQRDEDFEKSFGLTEEYSRSQLRHFDKQLNQELVKNIKTYHILFSRLNYYKTLELFISPSFIGMARSDKSEHEESRLKDFITSIESQLDDLMNLINLHANEKAFCKKRIDDINNNKFLASHPF